MNADADHPQPVGQGRQRYSRADPQSCRNPGTGHTATGHRQGQRQAELERAQSVASRSSAPGKGSRRRPIARRGRFRHAARMNASAAGRAQNRRVASGVSYPARQPVLTRSRSPGRWRHCSGPARGRRSLRLLCGASRCATTHESLVDMRRGERPAMRLSEANRLSDPSACSASARRIAVKTSRAPAGRCNPTLRPCGLAFADAADGHPHCRIPLSARRADELRDAIFTNR